MAEQEPAEPLPVVSLGKDRKRHVVGLILIGLGLCLQAASYLFALQLDPCKSYLANRFAGAFIFGMGLGVIGLAHYARARGRRVFWGCWGMVPILGPIGGWALLSVWSPQLSSTARAQSLVPPVVIFLVVVVLPAVAIHRFLGYANQSFQIVARTTLEGVFIAERTYYEQHKRYGTFEEIGFKIQGTHHRYTYRIDRSGAPGTMIPAAFGCITPDNTVVQAGISSDGQHFTTTATGNIDNDQTIDQLHVNDAKKRVQQVDVNDVTD